MPRVDASNRMVEAGALLRADLATCCACTLDGLRQTALHALAAVYHRPQRMIVRRVDPSGEHVSIVITGPDFFGVIKVAAPGYN